MNTSLHERLMRAVLRVAKNAVARRELDEQDAIGALGRLGLMLAASWHRVDPVAAERAAAEIDTAGGIMDTLGRIET